MIGHSVRQSKPEPSERSVPDSTPRGIVGFSDNQTVSEPLEHSRTCISDDPVPESGEAIVVGAIGLAAPWFLTGWAHEVEIEFMIDTGCQVTILSSTVLECMCIPR